MTTVLDYSDARPSPARVKAAGAVGAMRYLTGSKGSPKLIHADEVAALHAAGLGVGFVWETTSTRATAGYPAGVADATQANAEADQLGFPLTVPIFFAVDEDTSAASVAGYFQGAKTAGRRPSGRYGSAAVVSAEPDTGLRWQTAAWSHGQHVPCALYQHAGGSPIPGTDLNDLNDPTVLWTPTPAPTPPEDDMPLPLAVRSDKDGSVWVTTVDPKPARYHIPNADQLTALLVLGAVRVNGQGGAPAVVAQSFLDTVPTVT